MSTATILAMLPYPGLRPFEETDHALFFGREAQVSALLRQLEDHAFVAVLGSSGSGKSSLVRAGLLPAVREGFLLATTKWRFLVIRPGHRPYQRLVHALTSPMDSSGEIHSVPAGDQPATPAESRIISTLLGNDHGLLTALDESGISADTNVMIVVDQFEELFAFRRAGAGRDDVASRDEVAAFVNTLLCACTDPDGRVRVVLTMRSDFVGDCEAFLGLPEAVSRSQFLVPRLDRVQMEDAITRPGTIEEGGFRPFSFEQGLVNRIINDAGDRPDQLPLMQHALMRTWKLADQRTDRDDTSVQLMHKDYDAAGGIKEALSRHAEDAWKLIEGDQRKEEIVRRLFLLLCDISPDGQITRRRPRVTEVQAVTGAGNEELAGLIRHFQEDDRNFLFPRLEYHQNASDFLDVSHEALLRQWPRFASWQEQERQDASELKRLAEQAVLHSQKAGGLLSATDLIRISEWKKRVSVEWARRYVKQEAWEQVIAFIEKSENNVKKQRWKKWGLLLFIAVVLVTATAFSLGLMVRANSAKAAAQLALTHSFFRTIGLSAELSLDERAALWDLAELAPENLQVREAVIDRWFQTEESVLRGLRNNARGLRAASGLSVALQKRIMSRSKELADSLITVLEKSQQTDSFHLSSLGWTVSALAASMDPPEAAHTVARSASVLVTALENRQLTDGDLLSSLAKAVAALTASMDPPEAAHTAARSAAVLMTALEKSQQTDRFDLSSLAGAVAALAASMDPPEAAHTADRLVMVLENSQLTNSDRLLSLGWTVSALAARMDPPEAARTADRLVTALENSQLTNSDRLLSLGWTVSALAASMDPPEAAHTADRLVTVLENRQLTDGDLLSSLAKAVAALTASMDPPEAAHTAARSAAVLMTALEKSQQTDRFDLSSLAGAVAALAASMDPPEAAHTAARSAAVLMTALENPLLTDRSLVSSLAYAVAALAASMDPQEAARTADRLVMVLESPQLTDSSRLSSLAQAVAVLAARMDPQEAARTAARSTPVLVTALENPQETDVSPNLGRSLGNLAKFLPSAPRAMLLLALSNVFLEKIPAAPQQGQEEGQVRKEVAELCQLLSPQELAEVLKWPFTVGEAEKIVLTELERQTGQTFGGDVWKFVEQAHSLGITGLDAPAQQPHVVWVWPPSL